MTTVIAKYSQFVMPDHINVVGTLFGGQMIAWVDLAAAKASYRFLKGSDVDGSVTRTIEQVEFKEPVYLGDWVNFTAKIVEAGTTSLKIEVKALKSESVSGMVLESEQIKRMKNMNA